MYSHQSPKISVIVPVYNVEKYLPRCIDSILSQTFTDFELLLIDDGSPDNSGNICDEYALKDKRVRVFHKPNGGVSSARNLGIERTLGEWITFIDADDYIEQDFLSIPEDAIEDLLIQNYKVLKNGSDSCFDFERVCISQSQILPLLNENLVKRIFRVPWAKFFKKTIIEENEIRFLHDVKIGEDSLFMLDYLFYVNSVRYLSSGIYIYIKGENETINKYEQSVYQCIKYLRVLMDKYEKLGVNSIPYLVFMFTFYHALISPKNYPSLLLWKGDKKVKLIYDTIKNNLGWKWRIRYEMSLMFAFFKR